MKRKRFTDILKRNASYIAVALCILAVGLSIVFVLVSQNEQGAFETVKEIPQENKPTAGDDDTPEIIPTDVPEQTEVKNVTFVMPVSEPLSIELYTETMAYNSTLKRYSAHLATDFYAAEGTPVYAVYDGVVEKVENSLLKGVTVTIDHGNGLKTVYNSLEDAEFVSAAESVKKGDIIGYVSVTNRQESSDGAHLHFEVLENGVSINPSKYLTIDEK